MSMKTTHGSSCVAKMMMARRSLLAELGLLRLKLEQLYQDH